MNFLSLTLFNQFSATLGDDAITGFRTRKVQALLIYLIMDPAPHRRESLMTLLWPGMPERSARQNLRQVLYNLRQAIPELPAKDGESETPVRSVAETAVPLLITNRQTIQLNPQANISSDVVEFAYLLRSEQIHDHVDLLTCQPCRQNLEDAVSLYQGDFLVDFYLDDSNPFEEWIETQRQTLRRQALDALETLTAIHMRQKNFPQARGYAQRQLEIDDLREGAYRQLMEIFALDGQREEALAQYEQCRRLLAEELGMAPTSRTTAIYNKIVDGDLRFDEAQTQGVRGYELKDEIGEGAYGTIYRAIQPTIGRDVAVKVIRRKYANDPQFIRRFEAEAQTIARLEHPYIVPLYDYWRDPQGAFLVMRLLRGGNLLTSLAQGPWDMETTSKLLDQIASALAAAHQQGIIHRDIKPANILFDKAGNAYLSDFGIAKNILQDLELTGEMGLVGTPDYISPEQLRNEPVTPQSDLYSLGAVVYEVLTGERPFTDAPFALRIQKHLQEPLPLVSAARPGLPAAIDDVIQQATAKQPSARFSDALVMAEAFRQAVRGKSVVTLAGETTTSATLSTGIPAITEIYNPYKGLQAFQETDADDFYGRETVVEQFITHLADNRFLAVVGPSGSGKSSVVKAGLIPALRQEALPGSDNWFMAEMVPGPHPFEELELALLPIAVDPPPSLLDPMRKDERGLLRTIRRILPEKDGVLLLVIDQFEELFTLVEDDKQRLYFLNSLVTALNAPRSPLRLVVTLRADFYDRPLQIQPIAQLFKQYTEIILPLTQEELTWAIQEPARRVGVHLEAVATTAMLTEVADQPGALPLLQYALTELFEERQDNVMTLAAYRMLGGVSGALAQRAEEIYTGSDETEQEAIRQLFLRLVTLGEGVEDTRRRVLLSELEQISLDMLDEPKSSIINRYGSFRLLTFDHDPLTREPTVEVAHEALLREWPRLRRWLEQSRDDVRLQRSLATFAYEWAQNNEDDGFLLREGRLDLFAGWAATMDLALTPSEQAFLTASTIAREQREAAEQARQQRELETAQQLAQTEHQRAEEQVAAAQNLRRRAAYLGAALAVAAILAIAALFAGIQANNNAETAVTNANTAATQEALAAAQAEEAQNNADLAATAEAQAVQSEGEALAQQATAEAEAIFRATAEAIAVAERNTAEEQTRLSTSRELALAALSNLNEDPELSILLALGALGTSHTAEAEEALHRAVQESQTRLLLRPNEEEPTLEVLFSPDGLQLLTGVATGEAILWDVDTGEKLVTFDGHKEDWVQASDISYVISPDYSPDGKRVVTGGEDGTVRIWDPKNGQELMAIEAHEDRVDGVSFSPDGAKILTASWDNTAKIWDSETGELLLAVEEIHPPTWDIPETGAWGAGYSPDGRRFATAGTDGLGKVWDAETGAELLVLAGHDAPLWDVAFSPDGMLIATSSFSGEARIWDAETGKEIHNLVGHTSSLRELDFSHDGSLLGTASADGTAKIWDVASGEELTTLAGHKDRVMGIDFSPDGTEIATSSRDRTARIWEVSGGRESFALGVEIDGVLDVDYSPDGQRLATIDWDGLTQIWNAFTGEELFTLEGHEDWSGKIEYSSDGKLLATASDDGTAIVRDAQTGELIYRLDGHEGEWVNDLAFNADGTLLATAGNDHYAVIWDMVTGTEQQRFDHGDEVRGGSGSLAESRQPPLGSWRPRHGGYR